MLVAKGDKSTASQALHLAADGGAIPEANGVELSGFGALGTWRRRVARAPLTAEEALKHLLLSVDVDKLYRCFHMLHTNRNSSADSHHCPCVEHDGPSMYTDHFDSLQGPYMTRLTTFGRVMLLGL